VRLVVNHIESPPPKRTMQSLDFAQGDVKSIIKKDYLEKEIVLGAEKNSYLIHSTSRYIVVTNVNI
jgi:hypothetical protein